MSAVKMCSRLLEAQHGLLQCHLLTLGLLFMSLMEVVVRKRTIYSKARQIYHGGDLLIKTCNNYRPTNEIADIRAHSCGAVIPLAITLPSNALRGEP